MLKDPHIIGYAVAMIFLVLIGYWIMSIFVSVISSLHKQVEEAEKRKKEEAKKMRPFA